ncbi:MAG: glutathione S-transferase family protein [Pseudomonadota bacterium]
MTESEARYELLYWPLPFRGCFISYLFAYRNVPLIEVSDFAEVRRRQKLVPGEQAVPFMGPPTLYDRETGLNLSQMPAIVLYAAPELDLMPESNADVAMGLKTLMDCNDILMEICRYNGSSMWTREEWTEFRSRRFPRWLQVLEASLQRGFFGRETVSFADIGVYALLGNMTRCIPELAGDVANCAPNTQALCLKIGSEPSLAGYVAAQQASYGRTYCGGQIEDSIREMVSRDAD